MSVEISKDQQFARLAEYLERACTDDGEWMIAGPGALALVNRDVRVGELACVGSGTAMTDACRRLVIDPPQPGDPLLDEARAAVAALQVIVDATWSRDRGIKDRPKAARAIRVGLALAQPCDVRIEGRAAPLRVSVAPPVAAYLVELALYNEAKREPARREAHATRAFRIYQEVGAATIEAGLWDIRALEHAPFRERRRAGVRRGDSDAFNRWHELFLKERSARPDHRVIGNVLGGIRKATDWAFGRDLDRPEPPARGR